VKDPSLLKEGSYKNYPAIHTVSQVSYILWVCVIDKKFPEDDIHQKMKSRRT